MGIKTSIFEIDPSADLECVWQLLEDFGCSLLYSDADESNLKIYGHLPADANKQLLLENHSEILAIDDIELPDIDWEAQWAVHRNYREGFLHIDLKDYAPEIQFYQRSSLLKLRPGPGFGDLSHATTRLVLKLMPFFVKNKAVVDIGCGSGILSLAAVAMGCASVTGIDIDPEALVHSEVNSQSNGMTGKIKFLLPEKLEHFCNDSVVLMNMIQSEQAVVWESLASYSSQVSLLITSGILYEERNDYLIQSKLWGWQLVKEMEEEGWLGFIFKK